MNGPAIFSLVILAFWLVVYSGNFQNRKDFVRASFLAIPLGLMLSMFVPWLSGSGGITTIEFLGIRILLSALILTFVVGGFTMMLYSKYSHSKKSRLTERETSLSRSLFVVTSILTGAFLLFPFRKNLGLSNLRNRTLKDKINLLCVLLALAAFLLSFIFVEYPIYIAIGSMLFGLELLLLFDRQSGAAILIGGLLFTLIYFCLQILFNMLFLPEGLINMGKYEQLISVQVAYVSVEEILLVFVFGLLWLAVYELVRGKSGV